MDSGGREKAVWTDVKLKEIWGSARPELEGSSRHRLKKELGVVQKDWNCILEKVGP